MEKNVLCECGHLRSQHVLTRRRDGSGWDQCGGADRRGLPGTRAVGADVEPALVACGCRWYHPDDEED